MKYHALSVIFEKKSGKIWNCRLLQIIGGALRVKGENYLFKSTPPKQSVGIGSLIKLATNCKRAQVP